MGSKWTILNVSAIVYLTGCIVFTLIDYSNLSGGEGWGIAYMTVLIALGLSALLVDLIIRKIFRNRKTQQIVSIIVTVIYIVVIYIGS